MPTRLSDGDLLGLSHPLDGQFVACIARPRRAIACRDIDLQPDGNLGRGCAEHFFLEHGQMCGQHEARVARLAQQLARTEYRSQLVLELCLRGGTEA